MKTYPDFGSWENIQKLPQSRFNFCATLAALVGLGFLVRDSNFLVVIITLVIAVLGWFKSAKRGNVNEEKQDGEVESSSILRSDETLEKVDEDVSINNDDGDDRKSLSSVRAPLFSKEKWRSDSNVRD